MGTMLCPSFPTAPLNNKCAVVGGPGIPRDRPTSKSTLSRNLERSRGMDYPIAASRPTVRAPSALSQVYRWMTAGLALTGAVTVLALRSEALLAFIYGNVVV